jgi:hypothetical protein
MSSTSARSANVPIPCSDIHHRTSHAFELVCGSMSQAIGAQIGYPHTDFLTLPGPAMHICGMIVAHPNSANSNIRGVVNYHRHNWRGAAFIADPRFDESNLFVLKKMKLGLWKKADYRKLSAILEMPTALKVMAHTNEITPQLVATLFHLPPALQRSKIVRQLVHQDAAKLVAKMFSDHSDRDLQKISSSLNSADNRQEFWTKVSENFFKQFSTLPAGPVIDDDRVTAIKTVQELERAGLEFRNCLREWSYENQCGEQGFYVFHGEEKCVICYEPRINSPYMIVETQGPNNTPVTDETMNEIRKVFHANGFVFKEDVLVTARRQMERHLFRIANEKRPEEASKIALDVLDQLNRVQA